MTFYIQLFGNICAGKTTALNILKPAIDNHFTNKKVDTIIEPTHSNLYLPLYYVSGKYAYELQIYMKMLQAEEFKRTKGDIIITDFNEPMLFSKMMYKAQILTEKEYRKIEKQLPLFKIPKPNLAIFINTTPEKCFEINKKRAIKENRDFEKDISLQYFVDLDDEIAYHRFKKYSDGQLHTDNCLIIEDGKEESIKESVKEVIERIEFLIEK